MKMQPDNMQSDLIARLKQLQTVQYGEVELSHAGASPIYFDFKKAYGDAETRHLLILRLGAIIPNRTNCIAGGGYGGIPLATGISMLFKQKFYINNE